MLELIENIKAIEGLLTFEVEEGLWQNEYDQNMDVQLITLTHEFISFEDSFYLELVERFPENDSEYEDGNDFYTSTFVVKPTV